MPLLALGLKLVVNLQDQVDMVLLHDNAALRSQPYPDPKVLLRFYIYKDALVQQSTCLPSLILSVKGWGSGWACMAQILFGTKKREHQQSVRVTLRLGSLTSILRVTWAEHDILLLQHHICEEHALLLPCLSNKVLKGKQQPPFEKSLPPG